MPRSRADDNATTQALEAQKKAALDKTKEPVIAVPEVVYPNLGTHYAVQAEKVAQEQAAAAKAAEEAAKKAEAAVNPSNLIVEALLFEHANMHTRTFVWSSSCYPIEG